MKSEIRRNIGESGPAQVTRLKSGLRVSFEQTGNAYQVEDTERWDADGRANGVYRATMNQKGDKLLFLSPMPGQYIAEFFQIGHRTNDVPEIDIQRGGPRESSDGRRWWQDDQMVWKPQLKILNKGLYEGMLITYVIPYNFAPVPGSLDTKISGARAAVNQIENFLRAAGVDLLNTEIPYSPNILPWLERLLTEVKKPFLLTINEDGFIDRKSLSSVPDQLLEGLSTPKKATKKRAK